MRSRYSKIIEIKKQNYWEISLALLLLFPSLYLFVGKLSKTIYVKNHRKRKPVIFFLKFGSLFLCFNFVSINIF